MILTHFPTSSCQSWSLSHSHDRPILQRLIFFLCFLPIFQNSLGRSITPSMLSDVLLLVPLSLYLECDDMQTYKHPVVLKSRLKYVCHQYSSSVGVYCFYFPFFPFFMTSPTHMTYLSWSPNHHPAYIFTAPMLQRNASDFCCCVVFSPIPALLSLTFLAWYMKREDLFCYAVQRSKHTVTSSNEGTPPTNKMSWWNNNVRHEETFTLIPDLFSLLFRSSLSLERASSSPHLTWSSTKCMNSKISFFLFQRLCFLCIWFLFYRLFIFLV